MSRRGIICGGSIVVDVNKVIDRLPPPEELAIIGSQSSDTGGPGLNMAVDLARLGCGFPIDLVGLVGDDAHGRLVLDTCAALGIGTRGVGVVADVVTSYTDAMIENAKSDAYGQAFPDADASTGVKQRYGEATNIRDFDGKPGELTEMDALVAYLQVLGTMVDFTAYEPLSEDNRR